jgi:hypothetical protein
MDKGSIQTEETKKPATAEHPRSSAEWEAGLPGGLITW